MVRVGIRAGTNKARDSPSKVRAEIRGRDSPSRAREGTRVRARAGILMDSRNRVRPGEAEEISH